VTKRSILPQRPRHILVYDEDWEYLSAMFGPGAVKPVGISPAIRAIIHAYVGKLRQRAIDTQDGRKTPDTSEIAEGPEL
jgi:hypothetical protein